VRETAQRQADGASKAKHRIQPVVQCGRLACGIAKNPTSAELSAAAGALSVLVRHRRCGASVGPAGEALLSSTGVGAYSGFRRVRTTTGHVSVCQRMRWAGLLRVGGVLMTSLLGSAPPAGIRAGCFNVTHCRFGGE
jgi:hypothetical protein